MVSQLILTFEAWVAANRSQLIQAASEAQAPQKRLMPDTSMGNLRSTGSNSTMGSLSMRPAPHYPCLL